MLGDQPAPGLHIHPEARHDGPGDRPVLGGIGTPPRRDATRAIPDAHRDGGGDEVGDGKKIHQRKKPRPSWRDLYSLATDSTLAGRGYSRVVWRLPESRGLRNGCITTPILRSPSHPVKTVPRASTIGVRARLGSAPSPRAPSDRAPSSTSGIGAAASVPGGWGSWLVRFARSRSLRGQLPGGSSSSRSGNFFRPGGHADEARSASATSAPGLPVENWSPGAAP
jgi:hypothetical protein